MMTIISDRIMIAEKHRRVAEIIPLIIELLKKNPEGLNFSQIIGGLRETIEYSDEVKGDISIALRAKFFLKTKKGNKNRIIYKIHPDS